MLRLDERVFHAEKRRADARRGEKERTITRTGQGQKVSQSVVSAEIGGIKKGK